MPIKHIVIPDTQIHPGSNLDHLHWAGKYFRDQVKQDKDDIRLIILGDWADMPSLSSYDEGKKQMEGRTIMADIDAANEGLEAFMSPLQKWNKARLRAKRRQIWPISMDATLGNHENRINLHVEANPKLAEFLSTDLIWFAENGITPHDFLETIEYEGVLYAHFFPRGPRGHVTQTRNGAPSARLMLMREHRSCTAGHQQGLDPAVLPAGDRILYGLIAGSFYPDDFDYLSPQGTTYWRGIIVKHDVHDGEYCPMYVDIPYLQRRYAK